MPPRGGARIARKVIVTSVENPDDVRVFTSLLGAAKALGLAGGHSATKRLIEKGIDYNGYKCAYAEEGAVVTVIDDAPTPPDVQLLHYTFFDEVDELFKGEKIRYTNTEPTQVSVLDVIRVMTGGEYYRKTWVRVQEHYTAIMEKCHTFQFPGQGQNPTPVADVATIIEIINVLPGHRAAKFRASGAKVLVRVLGGDETLVDEIRENAARMEALRNAPADVIQAHPIYAFQMPGGMGSNAHKSILFSPSMQGKTVADFQGPCTYLILFKHEDKVAVKFGWTKGFKQRVVEHARYFPDMRIWYIQGCKTCDHANNTEQLFKDRMLAYLHTINLPRSNSSEVLLNVAPEEAEAQMKLAYSKVCRDLDGDDAFEQRKFEAEMELKKIEAEMEMKRLEVERLKITLEIERLRNTTTSA